MAVVREITFAEALNEALDYEMSKDEKVIVMGEDVGVYGGIFGVTKGLYEKYGPERVKDTPIAESGFIGTAVGAAATGRSEEDTSELQSLSVSSYAVFCLKKKIAIHITRRKS